MGSVVCADFGQEQQTLLGPAAPSGVVGLCWPLALHGKNSVCFLPVLFPECLLELTHARVHTHPPSRCVASSTAGNVQPGYGRIDIGMWAK